MSARTLIFNRIAKKRSLKYPAVYELRFLPEVRATASPSGRTLKLEGHAAVFNTHAKLKGFRERILPGAFKRVIEGNADVPALWNHNIDKIIGRTLAGTLRLAEDARGLAYSIDLPNTEEARGFHESVRRGDVSGSSFGFSLAPDDDDWDEAQDTEDRSWFAQRTIKNVSILRDVSPVIYPAYSGTDSQARAVEVPYEIRASLAEKNTGVIVTPEIAIGITVAAMERHKREDEARNRRKNLLNQILSQ